MAGETDHERRVVYRWMTRHGAETVGPALDKAYPVDQANSFDDALAAIDDAERELRGGPLRADRPAE